MSFEFSRIFFPRLLFVVLSAFNEKNKQKKKIKRLTYQMFWNVMGAWRFINDQENKTKAYKATQ